MNLFELPSERAADEIFYTLTTSDRVLVERIVSSGQRTGPGEWLEGTRDEWVAVLQGHAELAYADGTLRSLGPGDHVLIPAGVQHRVEATSVDPPCVWLAVHADGLSAP